MKRYRVGFHCVKGGGHTMLYSDPNYDNQCGNGWPVFIEVEDEDAAEARSEVGALGFPAGYWEGE